MDKMIYIAMTGAKHAMYQQAATAHNLANASTTGFRAELNAFRALPVYGDGMPTRVFVADSTVGADFTPGVLQDTGRDLDVAVEGKGWLAVQMPDGTEAYTRDGSLQMSPNGLLQTRHGLNIMGDAGPIAIPPNVVVSVGKDGTVSTVPTDQTPNTVAVLGRIKLVNPPEENLVKSGDGLFRLKDGNPAPADVNVKLTSGALEGSNVNVVDSLVSMIDQARAFEMNMRLLRTADEDSQQASRIMNLNA
ncbi:MAG: flagellar basal-body rod protein FlgF [Sulfuricellaceae bacterium]